MNYTNGTTLTLACYHWNSSQSAPIINYNLIVPDLMYGSGFDIAYDSVYQQMYMGYESMRVLMCYNVTYGAQPAFLGNVSLNPEFMYDSFPFDFSYDETNTRLICFTNGFIQGYNTSCFQDQDLDGLSTYYEWEIGTNPYSNDTDSDEDWRGVRISSGSSQGKDEKN